MNAILKTAAKLLLERGVQKSYSQFGEDAVIQSLFRKNRDGVYVDIGTYHPIQYSNTYALYRKGWSGVVVDANASLKPLYDVFRARDRFVCAAVGKGGEFFMFNDGAYNTFDSKEAEKRKEKLKFIRSMQVEGTTLPQLIKEQNLTRIDFLNIDVEGKDLEVLQSHDWRIKPTVIAIESENEAGNLISALLKAQGYTLVGQCGLTLIWRV